MNYYYPSVLLNVIHIHICVANFIKRLLSHFGEVTVSDSPSSNSKWEIENDIRRNRFTVHFKFISESERKSRRNVNGASQ